MNTAKFQLGDRVLYTTKRLKGTVTALFPSGGSHRYYVRTKSDIWSVAETDLQMQKIENLAPETTQEFSDNCEDSESLRG